MVQLWLKVSETNDGENPFSLCIFAADHMCDGWSNVAWPLESEEQVIL
jgi:hypothetical protein